MLQENPELIALTSRVCSELTSLVGWGINPERLVSCGELRKLAGVKVVGATEEEIETAYETILRFLKYNIEALTDSKFEGKMIPADRMKKACRLLLKIDGQGDSVVTRRFDVLFNILELKGSESRWRRGRERKFLYILAESIVQPDLQTS